MQSLAITRALGIAQWLERRTRDSKVTGSNPAGATGEFSSPGSTFCADSYFDIPSTPVLPQWHVKDPGHSARQCRWQVTVKHACTLRVLLCMK